MNRLIKAISILISRSTWFLRPKPDFIIIGAQKSGTRSLKKYLSAHSQISLTDIPEVHYFDLNYEKGMTWYRSYFKLKDSGKITGECSPYYLFHPQVPERIHRDLPNCKFIVLLRDPVERAYSHYRMRKGRSEEPLDIIDSHNSWNSQIEEEEKKIVSGEQTNITYHQKYSYCQRGEYAKQIRRWFDFFNSDQFLFIQSEQFFNKPQKTMNQISLFLGIKDEILHDNKVYNKGKLESNMTATEREFLREYFKPHNEELYKLLDQQFNWQ